jgi:hypothetical protein
LYIDITRSPGGTVDKISPDGCGPAGCTKPVDCPMIGFELLREVRGLRDG